MATAKTTKSAPAAKPVAAKPAVAKPAASKPAAAVAAKPSVKPASKPIAVRAADSKPDEKAVVHSAQIIPEQPAKPAAQPEPQPVAHVAQAAAETVEEAVAVKPAKAVAVVAKAAPKAADDATDSVLKGVAPLIDFSRDNAILLVSTGNQLALGWHKMSLSLLDWSAESCDKSVAAGRAILSAKTVEEVIDLSQALAKDGLKQLLEEGSELSALSTRLIEDTIVPLPVRLAAAVEKLASHAA
jgi:hypothetical protein